MNLVDCYVTQVLSKPTFEPKSGCWGVKVKFDSYGRESETTIYLDTKAEASRIKIGYQFLH
jgi:hypothetical protein